MFILTLVSRVIMNLPSQYNYSNNATPLISQDNGNSIPILLKVAKQCILLTDKQLVWLLHQSMALSTISVQT